MKCYLVRETASEKGEIRFELNEQSFIVHVVPDRQYRVIDLQAYSKEKQKEKLQNKLVCIGEDMLVYPR